MSYRTQIRGESAFGLQSKRTRRYREINAGLDRFEQFMRDEDEIEAALIAREGARCQRCGRTAKNCVGH